MPALVKSCSTTATIQPNVTCHVEGSGCITWQCRIKVDLIIIRSVREASGHGGAMLSFSWGVLHRSRTMQHWFQAS